MPLKKRGHGHHKHSKEKKEHKGSATSSFEDRQGSRTHSYHSPRIYYGKSQPGQATPKPAAQVSVVKPSQLETNTLRADATVIDMSTSASRGSPTLSTKTAPASQIRGPTTLPSALVETIGRGTQSASTTSGTLTASALTNEESRKDKAKPSVPATNVAGSVKMEQTTPAQSKEPAVDPFDALASILPSADSIAPPKPEYTGPEVTEPGVISEDDPKCGEKEDTLPPGYRLEDMPAAPADWKPPDAPKPLSTDEALDSLSAGFMTSNIPEGPSKTEKMNTLESACSASAGKANFAKPPADKKAKMEKGSDYIAGIKPTPFKKASPTSERKGLGDETSTDFSLTAGLVTKPDTKKKLETPSMSLDAVSALGELLPVDAPKPEPPKLKPEDIVSERKHEEDEAKFVGERDDTIHPDFRFNKEELEKLPAPKPEPSMGTSDALDILSGDFISSTTASAVQAPVVTPHPPSQKGLPPVADDFSLEAGLSASTVKKLESSAVPPTKTKGKETSNKSNNNDKSIQEGSMSLGALDALSDLLPVDEPKPELPEIKPEDILKEDKLKEEEAVFVGEREDTIPEEYRFNKEELEKLPAPKPEPTIGTGDALDFLSGDLTDSTVTPAASAPVVCLSSHHAEVIVDDLSALDVLSGDFASSKSAPTAYSSAPPPMQQKTVCQPPQGLKSQTDKGEPMSLDALSALSDSLPTDIPKPKLPELRPEDIVSEEKHKEDSAVLVGEREDTIPEEYRFNKKELEKLPAPKPEPTIGTGEALDFLSEGLMTSAEAPSVQAPVVASTASLAQSSADAALDALSGEFASEAAAPTLSASLPADTETELQLSAGADNALDALSDTLKDIKPVPQPAPLPPKNIVNEKKVVEERLIKMGERDDTLPPEYRPSEEELQNIAEATDKEALKPKPSLDDKTALDLLSKDFSAGPDPATSSKTCALQSSVPDSESVKPMPGPVLETLSKTLLPGTPEFQSLPKQPKENRVEVPSDADLPPAPQSSDVLPTSLKKGEKR